MFASFSDLPYIAKWNVTWKFEYKNLSSHNHIKLCSHGGNICLKEHLAFARPSISIHPIILRLKNNISQLFKWIIKVFAHWFKFQIHPPPTKPCTTWPSLVSLASFYASPSPRHAPALAGTQLFNILHMPSFFAHQWLCSNFPCILFTLTIICITTCTETFIFLLLIYSAFSHQKAWLREGRDCV